LVAIENALPPSAQTAQSFARPGVLAKLAG
jgi:hypothetical protein